jgi:hypothetical protein|tara:strand:- start:76 stop:432 length:357 start_codon:yes stop_codon:yes gene_type:complete
LRRGKTLDFVKVRLLSRLLLFIGSLSFSVYILSREKESESVIVVSVSSVLDSLSLFVRVVLFLLKVWSKDHREERERELAATLRRRTAALKATTTLFSSPFREEFMLYWFSIRSGIQN